MPVAGLRRQRSSIWRELLNRSPAERSLVKTNIPARLDRLPWGLFHTRVVVALGITWVLDGLEVTIAGAISGALKQSPNLHFSNADVGIASSAYLAGAVVGAIFFGWLTDQPALVWLALRSCSQAAISSMRVCLSGMRRSRHWDVRTPSWTRPDRASCRVLECSAIRSARPGAWLRRPERLRRVKPCCGC